MRHVTTQGGAVRRWPWVLLFVVLSFTGCYVVLLGLIAPWTDAPEGASMTLLVGGLGLVGVATGGVFSSVEKVGRARPWLVRWVALVSLVVAATVAFYVID